VNSDKMMYQVDMALAEAMKRNEKKIGEVVSSIADLVLSLDEAVERGVNRKTAANLRIMSFMHNVKGFMEYLATRVLAEVIRKYLEELKDAKVS